MFPYIPYAMFRSILLNEHSKDKIVIEYIMSAYCVKNNGKIVSNSRGDNIFKYCL